MQKRETCVDCGLHSPETSSDHTLTSSMGWRLMRRQFPDGSWHAEWRCGVCWAEHKVRAKYTAEITRVRATTAPTQSITSTAIPSRLPSGPAATPEDARTMPPIAAPGKMPFSLAAPSRPLVRRSR